MDGTYSKNTCEMTSYADTWDKGKWKEKEKGIQKYVEGLRENGNRTKIN